MNPRMLLIILGAAGALVCFLFAVLCFLPSKRKKTSNEDNFDDDNFEDEDVTSKKAKKAKKPKRKRGKNEDEDEDDEFGDEGFSSTPPAASTFQPAAAPSNPFGNNTSPFTPITVAPAEVKPSSNCEVDATEYLKKLFEAFESMDIQPLQDSETEDLISSHETILNDYKNSGALRVTKLITKSDQRDVDVQTSNGWDYVTTEVDAVIQDYIKDINTGEVAGGSVQDTYAVHYLLTFARMSGTPAYALYHAALV